MKVLNSNGVNFNVQRGYLAPQISPVLNSNGVNFNLPYDDFCVFF